MQTVSEEDFSKQKARDDILVSVMVNLMRPDSNESHVESVVDGEDYY